MSKKYCIADWKMYLNNTESENFSNTFLSNSFNNNCEIVICPSYTSINSLSAIFDQTNIKIGSQDLSIHESGAYTGEISLDMLYDLKCSYAIIGHSERRIYHNESNSFINTKLNALDKSSIIPVICIGETLEEKESGITETVLNEQVKKIFENCGNSLKDCIIAYEPIWAIGTGISADMETIERMHGYIKNIIQKIAENYRNLYLLYGGSVNENNASDILSIKNVDGFLIGSSSIDPRKFYNICNKF